MQQDIAKIGYISATTQLVIFLLFTACFVIIAIINPYFPYENFPDYVAYMESTNQLFKYIAQSLVVLYCPVFVIILHCLGELNPEGKTIYNKISISMGMGFCILVSLNYFVQISGLRFSIENQDIEGLQHFFMFNPHSPFLSIAMLGWTLFFGISSLFLLPMFTKTGVEKKLRIIFMIQGINAMIGGIAYIFQVLVLVNMCMNVVMGGTLLGSAFFLMKYFQQRAENEQAN